MPTVSPQLFSKHKDEWLNFYIVLKDAKQAAQLQADHPNGVALSPIDAGIFYELLLHRLRDGDAGAAEPVGVADHLDAVVGGRQGARLPDRRDRV